MPIAISPPQSEDDSVLRLISLSESATDEALAKQLLVAAKSDGFFYLQDHGIPQALIDGAFGASSSFFLGAPESEKVAGNGDMGYTAPRVTDNTAHSLSWFMPSSGDYKESFFVADSSYMSAHNLHQQLPPTLEEKREVLDRFVKACGETAKKILRGLAVALGWDREALVKYHNGQHNRLRLLHYPPVSSDHQPADPNVPDIRAGAHTDLGSLTLLFQHHISGLQVSRHGQWLDVAPREGCVVVNIGDALEFWSGAKLRSTIHRVVMPRTQAEQASRFSIAYFIQPDDETVLEPLGHSNVSEEEFGDIIESKGVPRDTKRVLGGEYKAMRVKRAQRGTR
ncbi:hypothetical protein I350_05651 [Cryptococcus amylolentus CBS 6273]|uniref:Fe2OG dioxygenase domain-containing protein n=1 Tax=Cryptococcus amylolentus CBS 6273 TaxID=1296118 RepID=A0A1E3JW07_9TREE|nr:hypothetical protein I350_05651 [Cryptococcus amylolentus CBS 6273]